MRPFTLRPALVEYLWGGTRLIQDFGKQSQSERLGESWELSAHPAAQSVIADGEFAGTPFGDWVAAHPTAVGEGFKAGDEFPILTKIIDAAQALSIQVHPDDGYARRVENQQGKTEMWVVLDAEPGAFIYYGFEAETTREEMAARIADDTICEVLHKQPVQPGDVYFIPAGTIHAIGAGLLVAEVQQSSNVTYRVYDFGRLDADGNPRQLHVDKALDVTKTAPATGPVPGAGREAQTAGYTLDCLASCPYFTVRRLGLHGSYEGSVQRASFVSLLCLAGSAQLHMCGQALPLEKGTSVFIPAQDGAYTLEGEASLLITSV